MTIIHLNLIRSYMKTTIILTVIGAATGFYIVVAGCETACGQLRLNMDEYNRLRCYLWISLSISNQEKA